MDREVQSLREERGLRASLANTLSFTLRMFQFKKSHSQIIFKSSLLSYTDVPLLSLIGTFGQAIFGIIRYLTSCWTVFSNRLVLP